MVSSREKRSTTVAKAVLLVVLTIAAYVPALQGGYIWDDDSYLTENPVIKSPDGWRLAWVVGTTPQYYPLVFTTFWAEARLWGLEPMGYHAVNVLFHIFNSLLAWRLAAVLRIPGGFAAALLFALHPMHVESVAWITERKNVLSLFFYLISALIFLRFDFIRSTESGKGRTSREVWVMYGAALAAFAAALLSKTVAASLPVALVLMMLWQRSALTFRRLWPLAPMLVLGVIAGLHTGYLEQVLVGAAGPDFDQTFVERVLIASRALLFYPWKLFVPWPLMFTYPRWDVDVWNLVSWFPVLACSGVLVLVTAAYRRGWRAPCLGVLFYAVTIFPALGFANVYPMKFSFVADHFVYHASLGLIVLVTGSFVAAVSRTSLKRGVVGAVAAVYLALTFNQGRIYADEETLWRTTVARNPDAWMAHNNLAGIALETRDAEKAEYHARQSLLRKPEHFMAHINLTTALFAQNRLNEALDHADRALEELDALIKIHIAANRAYRAEQFSGIRAMVVRQRAGIREVLRRLHARPTPEKGGTTSRSPRGG
jgi:hypothetical protein